MLGIHKYESINPGNSVLIFGSIHGNEPCGPIAIQKYMEDLDSGKKELLKGSATFVPVANPRAHEKNLRQTEANLNRIFRKHRNPATYEAKLANQLTDLFDGTHAFVDLHSFSTPGKPFVMLDFKNTPPGNHKLIKILGPKNLVSGWPEMFAASGKSNDYDTTRYASERGIFNAIIECGYHSDPKAAGVAYKAIDNTLKYFGLITGRVKPAKKFNAIKMTKLFIKESSQDKFVRQFNHLDKVKKGSLIGIRASGEEVTAPEIGFILLPKSWSQKGEEWFYFGVGD